MTEILAVDPYRLNAYSNSVSFDLGFKDMYTKTVNVPQTEEDYNPEVSMKKTPSKEWELDVRALISTKKWLMNYGLKRNKLTLKQLLPVIGFKLSDDYDRTLKRPISSKYANGLFNQVHRPDGKTFNITCSREKLKLIEGRLTQALQLYRRRLDWLTSESRRVFGVIEERGLTVVLDIRNMSPQQFDQYRIAFEKVIYEQLTQVAKFNIIRAADDMQLYQPECVPVTHDTIGGAVQWLWKQDRLASVSKTAACEAVLKAISDPNNEAVYLFTEGTSIETCKEILHEKVVALKDKIPVHVVSYNCDSSDTVRSLKDFTRKTGSKFHAYAVIMEMDSYEGQPVDPKTNRANIVLKKKTYGGVPPGAGMRDDVVLLFEELEEARNILSSIQAVSQDIPEPKIQTESKINKAIQSADKDEQYMGSKEWIVKYGLHARGLEMFDILSGVAFKHEDGVVDVRKAPQSNTQTDSVSHAKLVNAKYCDKFPVVKWKDGRCVHVQVTPELHRHYEQKIKIAMNVFQQRIDWLNQGSRALFGTVIEDQIYIIIDTSASMLPSIQFLKEKLFVLMQEQLRHKMKVNFVSFNSKAVAWQNRLVEVDENSLQSAWKWIQNLSCWGSTNTYAALQIALSDPGTQAIYLLTDGRPDQPPKSIIAQVQMQHCVPVHSISFNCNDTEANRFLFDLSRATGGRYHNFSEKGQNSDQPESWESEDIRLLKEEIRTGIESLDKIEELRDECSNLSWNREVEKLKKCSRNHALPSEDRVSAVPAMDPNQLYRTPTPPPRPKSAPPQSPRLTPTPPLSRPKTARGVRKSSSFTTRQPKMRPQSARVEKTPLVAADKNKRTVSGHTRTSLLRTLNSSGRFTPDEWLLPETRQLFETQARKQKELAIVLQRFGLSPYVLDLFYADEKKEKARKVRKKRMVKANDSSSKLWLSRNGLVAKKLTILDALSPTFVPHEAKYVPILDKFVLSKVFDEILPLAHVSSRNKKKITLINPNAVDLKGYEKKVEKAIETYERRLNRIVWEALPQHVQEEFESEEPVSYADNKLKLMKALDEAGWPIKEDDITLLEDEIARGEKFIQQAKDLRKASSSNNDDDDSDDDVRSKSDSSGHSPRFTSRKDRSRSESRQSRSSSRQENSPRITTSRIDSPTRSNSARSRDESPRFSRTVSRQDDDDVLDVFDDKASLVSSLTANTNQDYEGLGHVIQRKQCKSAKNEPVKELPLSQKLVHKVLDTLKGQRVVARKDTDGFYYPGQVVKCTDPRHALVEFNDKQQKTIPTRLVIATGGAVACPPLMVGDYVLVRVINPGTDAECFVPGIVQVLPVRNEDQAKFYTVLMYNGQRATTMRTYLLKISKSRFEFAIRYIAEVQNEDRERIEENVYATPRKTDDSKKKSGISVRIRPPDSGRKSRIQRHRSRSDSSSDSRPRSPTPPPSEQSNTRSRSRSNSPPPPTPREKTSKRSRSRSRSDSRSRSRSRSRSDSRSKSRSRSRSRSDSRSRSRSGSRSRSRSKSGSRSRSRSRSKSPSARSKSPPHTKTESRSSSRDRSDRRKSGSRSASPEEKIETSRSEKEQKLYALKEKLQHQQEEQEKQQDLIRKQARKLKKFKKRMKKLKKKRSSSIDSQAKLQDEDSDSYNKEQERHKKSERQGSVSSSKAGPTGTPVTPSLLKIRKSLPPLREGEEVLARWSDEGWYFRGVVQQDCGDFSYYVEDATKMCEKIWREDIITDYDDANQVIQPKDPVVALHPHYSFSYSPGVVLEVYQNFFMKIRFYDGEEAKLPREEIYKLTAQKFEHDVNYIIECETRWVGQAIVARDDSTGTYRLASVKDRVGSGREYVVEWCDGDETIQHSINIFGTFTKHHPLAVGDHVLAMADEQQHIYLPGWVAGIVGNKINIKFCNGLIRDIEDILHCFWLSTDYYDNAVQFYKKFHPD